MSYTLAKWALWMVAAAAVGGVTGWLLRGAGRRSTELTHAAVTDTADATEVELLNAEIGALEAELAECRASAAAADTPSHDLAAESDAWAAKVARQDQLIAELRVRLWNSEAQLADLRAARTDG